MAIGVLEVVAIGSLLLSSYGTYAQEESRKKRSRQRKRAQQAAAAQAKQDAGGQGGIDPDSQPMVGGPRIRPQDSPQSPAGGGIPRQPQETQQPAATQTGMGMQGGMASGQSSTGQPAMSGQSSLDSMNFPQQQRPSDLQLGVLQNYQDSQRKRQQQRML